jgi:hypothetical protein
MQARKKSVTILKEKKMNKLDSAGCNPGTGLGGTAKECLTFDFEAPGTPDKVKKYRKSNNLEPGKRFQHWGVADDLKQMRLEYNTYGVFSDPGNVTAAELINHKALTDMQRINLEKSEKVYHGTAREPLGKTYDRKYVLPSKFTVGKEAFGVKSRSSMEPAKGIIFPTVTAEMVEGEDIYRRSHGYIAPGEQLRRNYKWNVDINTTRFGVKGDSIALNGVSHNIAAVLKGAPENKPPVVNTKRVEDFRNMSRDNLSESKNLGQDSGVRPFDMAYGKAGASSRATKGTWGAGEVIKGNYSYDDQMPDRDLGKSITPGFRNISLETRAFGVPSIRNDLPAAAAGMRRSLADSQNYGDDVPAQDLINPPAFSDLSIGPTAMAEYRPKDKLVALFDRIGYKIHDDKITDAIFREASQGGAKATINQYRDCLNRYMIALEDGSISEWYRQRGL